MSYGGNAIGRMGDGRAIFIPFGIPGEQVLVEVTGDKKTYLRGKIVEIVNPSPKRIKARCAHFQACGGCHYQHLAIEDQLAIKQQIMSDQLVHLGGFTNPPVLSIKNSPNPWNYRNSMQFHVSPNGKLGFRGVDPKEVIEIHECHLPSPGINETWPLLDFENGRSVDRIELREGNEEGLLLHLHTGAFQIPDFQHDIPISIVAETMESRQLVAGDDWIFMVVRGKQFRVSAGSFFQVNIPMAGEMVDYLLKNLDLSSDMTILDLYCGVGLFSAFMAPLVRTCIGVENSTEACEDTIFNLDQFKNVMLYEGSVEDIMPSLDVKAEIVLMDPPRSGVARKGLDAILAMKPKQIAYVSCDPATLARDLIYLTGNHYLLDSTQPFDLFPQTFHIETISILSREGEDRR